LLAGGLRWLAPFTAVDPPRAKPVHGQRPERQQDHREHHPGEHRDGFSHALAS
jgi:hypothetical protein